MTTKTGYYGSDAVDNRFKDPKTKEAYFTLVNKETGEIELYNEEFGADKRVGTLGDDGKWEYNKNWWGGANGNDKAFAEKILKDGTLKRQASTSIKNDLVDNEGLTSFEAANKANELLKTNKGVDSGSFSSNSSISNPDGGTDPSPGTREEGFPTGLVYPETLRESDNGQDFLKFDMLKYAPRGLSDQGSDRLAVGDREGIDKRIIGSVILPIPGGITNDTAVNWGSDSMTPLQLALSSIALDTIEKGFAAGVDQAAAQATKASRTKDVKKALGATIAGMASGAGRLLTRETGNVMNPNMELLFGGPNLRNFSFQFKLSPRNDEEAKTIIRIIRFFKQGMAPIRTKSRLFLKSPHTFSLSYRNSSGEQHKYLNKFKECALQSLGLNYTPEGNYATYEDGVMTSYLMTMTYAELDPVFNDDYGNEDEFGADPSIGF
tara:strand:- start:950 stop:2254 length:1305 start_codon:yes stop_codon:yes gene_type:complete